MEHNLFIYRSEGVGIGAYMCVTFDTEDSVDTEEKLLKCVKDGVTKWAATAEDGKRTYAYAGDDMNIGDLSNCEWLDIMDYCEGLRGVVFHEVVVPKNWTYDTSLCEELNLEKP